MPTAKGNIKRLSDDVSTSRADLPQNSDFLSQNSDFAVSLKDIQARRAQPISSSRTAVANECVDLWNALERPDRAIPPARHGLESADFVSSCYEKLGSRAQKIVGLSWMQILGDVPNCAAEMTRFFNGVAHTRLEHSIHTASKVRELNPHVLGKLSEHLVEVLECAALLHDLGHRRGSHALDRVLAAHPAAPNIEAWGWGKEFHEYHTAQLVATKPKIQELLGPIHGDVLAVLCHCDTRRQNGDTESFEKDFGKFKTLLSEPEIELLAELVEKVLDRNSCLELDFKHGGFTKHYVDLVHELVSKFENALTVHDGKLCVRVNDGSLPEGTLGWISKSDLHDYVSCRQLFREIIATAPTSCNVDVFLREAVFAGLRERGYSLSPSDHAGFEFLRSKILKGDYGQLLGQDAHQMLTRAPSDEQLLSVEDVIAPLVTITKADFDSLAGVPRFTVVSRKEALAVGGVARTDMTMFECELRRYLADKKVSADISVVITNDFEKIINYTEMFPDKTIKESPIFAVQTSPRATKVIIAARAIDSEGRPLYLGDLQKELEHFCETRSYLNKGCTKRYNRRIFCQPVSPERVIDEVSNALAVENAAHAAGAQDKGEFQPTKLSMQIVLGQIQSLFALFRPEVKQNMDSFTVKWEKMGKHGLRPSDGQPQEA